MNENDTILLAGLAIPVDHDIFKNITDIDNQFSLTVYFKDGTIKTISGIIFEGKAAFDPESGECLDLNGNYSDDYLVDTARENWLQEHNTMEEHRKL